jgi:hypothetical protein
MRASGNLCACLSNPVPFAPLHPLVSKVTRFGQFLRTEFTDLSHREKLISAAGGCAGILAILAVSQVALGLDGAAMVVASMGASAVLIFAVPHGPLSQPWPVFAGHLLSAFIGVGCAKLIADPLLAAAVAVGLAIAAMYYTRSIHPPGGATALSAVLGGESVYGLDFQFVVVPVLLNVMIILVIGVVFNAPFAWRRYPVGWARRPRQPEAEPEPEPLIAHSDLVFALSQIDSFIDVSESDLLQIYDLAVRRAREPQLPPEAIRLGGYYSNGEFGPEWSVRQVVDMDTSADQETALLIYKTVAGAGRRKSGVMSRGDFAAWARYEVRRDETTWRKLEPAGAHEA